MYPADTGTLHLLASTFRKLMIFVNLLSGPEIHREMVEKPNFKNVFAVIGCLVGT